MKTVFITGIGRGLGKEFFGQLTRKGYFAYGLLRNAEQYRELKAQMPTNAELILADISTDDCKEIISAAVGDKPIDLLINNAGIGAKAMYLDDVESQEVLDLFQVHCLGVLRVMQALMKNLLHSTNPVVLNMSSRFGSLGLQYDGTLKHVQASYAYRIAKAAQNMLTLCVRGELGDRIEFVSLTPGRLITELGRNDANLTPAEGAERIIDFWESGNFKSQNGILQVPDNLVAW